MDKIAILIPCYNEALTIKKVINDFKIALPEASIYVYDNNSTDNTVQLALDSGAVIRHEYQQGKGNVIRRMFREINAEAYIMVDGDDTYPAENAREMVDLVLNKNVDMVVGDRLTSTYFQENKRPFHNFGNSLVKFLVNLFFKGDIKDIMTGYRAFSYDFVKTFPVISKGFEIETEMTIHALENNLSLENVIITYRDRPTGSESKLNTISDGIKVIFTIIKSIIVFRPFVFFGAISLISLFIGVILNISLLNNNPLNTMLLILVIVSYVLCLLSLLTALLMNSINLNRKYEMENRLISIQSEKKNS